MSGARIRLSAKQAEAWRILDRPEVIEVFAGGGAGGGKSWLGCLRQIYRRTTYANTRGFIGRRDYTALRDSTMKTYFALLKSMGYESDAHYRYNAQEHIVYFNNGSEQHFRHMSYQPSDPDYNRFGSTEYTDAFIDESPEVDQRAAEIIISRLRLGHSEHGITPELLLTGNPSDTWVKFRYVMDIEGKFIDLPEHRGRVLFTIADNPDEVLRESYTKTLEHLDDYDRSRLLYGDWSAQRTNENRFATHWNEKKHVRPCEFVPQLPIIISMDFNIEPFAFIFAHVWQDGAGYHVHIFDEEEVEGGDIFKAVDRIRLKYGPHLWNATLTGDYNGNARNLGVKDGTSHFGQMQRELGIQSRQVQTSPNPRHVNSRNDLNYTLYHHPDYRVDPKCTGTIRDNRLVKADETGGIIKAKRSDIAQRADFMDAQRYLINHASVQKWIAYHQKSRGALSLRP